MKSIISSAALGLALFTSASAFAYDGYVTGSVSLRAGPDSSYPRVAHLRAGSSVVIEGCVDDWSWCDVSSHHDRGWVSARYLQNEYHGSRVLVPQFGVQIGIPIVSFVFGSYWDDHYRSQSWYHQRQHYSEVSTRYYQPDGVAHHGSPSPTYRPTTRAPVSQPRQTATAPQPAYHQKPATTTTTVAHAQPAPQPVAHEHVAAKSEPARQHKVAEAESAPVQHQKPQQHGNESPRSAAASDLRSSQPSTQASAHASPPVQQAKGKPSDQAGGNDKGNDQAGGKDKNKNKDDGGGKNEKKDHGGG